jgi:hypothetical protein
MNAWKRMEWNVIDGNKGRGNKEIDAGRYRYRYRYRYECIKHEVCEIYKAGLI